MTWRLIDEGDLDIYRNLAVEEALAKANVTRESKINTLRFWRSDVAVVVGRFQCTHKEANLRFCKKNKIPIARRFTGGGTVYHDLGNLNFSLCMNQAEWYVPRTLPELYWNYIGSIAEGLREVGIPATYDAHRSCLRIRGKKITGTAGWMKRGVSFIHGTLLIDADLSTLAKCLNPPPNQPIYLREKGLFRCMESRRDLVTSIAQEVPNCPSDKEIKDAIIRAIERLSKSNVEIGELDTAEKNLAEALYHERYSKVEWNLGYRASESIVLEKSL